MEKTKFVHLHLHTEYSLLDGLSKIKKLLSYVKENDMKAVAITDHGSMYGAIELYKKAKELEIKPIIGLESYISQKGNRKNFHLTLLAKNLEGYKNLMKITSMAHLEGFYYKPRIHHKNLKKYSKGIICLSGCAASELSQAILEKDPKKIEKTILWHQKVFGEDYYLEIQRHNFKNYIDSAPDSIVRNEITKMAQDEKILEEEIVKLSRKYGIPLVATNDAHYIKPEDAPAQDALVCISTGKNVSDTKRLRFVDTPAFNVTTPQQMQELFPDLPEALENTVKIADKCNIEITLGTYFFPKVDIPKGKTGEERLCDLVYQGAKELFGDPLSNEITERIEFELGVIIQKGYPEYFLIYKDMSDWAKSQRIPINTRGSAAGSLVSYCLGITSVDPIKYLLPFERFLNPYRPSAPDIDMDIADNKREEMLKYLVDRYGREKVAQICTFGRMLAKASVRDVARVLGFPYSTGDKIAKLIPEGSQGFPMTLERAFEESPELKKLYDIDKEAKQVLDLAKEIEGNARHISVHAAGVVISPTELTDFVPLQREPSGEKIITQYEMHACEDVGLVKLDVLGIRNLSILERAVSLVEKERHLTIDLQKIPVDDKKTFDMLSRGETMGTFQLGGSGMTRYLVELQPERIEDIMAMIALFRPGPIANIPEYIARKKGQSPVKFYHPKMKKYLKSSFGILVYQDDLLYTALEIAGYNWEEVDKFRKAVGKKIPEEMAKQHVIFVEGCMKHSKMSKKEAEGLWKLFEPFQGYGFNKAHAASYGMLSYQTAYMKANYPVEYMTALLTAESNDSDKVSQAVSECRKMRIIVLPPDINDSEVDFTTVKNEESTDGKAIRFGLEAIKHVGAAAIEAILVARKDGPFISFSDLCSRVDARKVNKKVVESLIKVGALSKFGSRAALLSIMNEVRARVRPQSSNGQQDLFSQSSNSQDPTLQTISSSTPEFPDEELENLERELLGLSLSAKPIEEVLSDLFESRSHKISDLDLLTTSKTDEIKVAGRISEIRTVVTKKTGADMAFIRVEDESGNLDIVVFPQLFSQVKDILIENNCILITGKFDTRDDRPSILANVIESKENLSKDKSIKLNVPENIGREKLLKLKELLQQNPGPQEIFLHFSQKNQDVPLPFKVTWSKDLSQKAFEILSA